MLTQQQQKLRSTKNTLQKNSQIESKKTKKNEINSIRIKDTQQKPIKANVSNLESYQLFEQQTKIGSPHLIQTSKQFFQQSVGGGRFPNGGNNCLISNNEQKPKACTIYSKYEIKQTSCYPFTAVCQIISKFENQAEIRGCGFFINQKIILTAACNLFSSKIRKNASQISIVFQNIRGETKKCNAKHIKIPQQYYDKNKSFDFGIVTIAETNEVISQSCGYLGYNSLWNNIEEQLFICGYFNEKQSQVKQMRAVKTQKIHAQTNRIYYDIQTGSSGQSGQSGSPILRMINNQAIQVVGIHIGENHIGEIDKYTSYGIILCKRELQSINDIIGDRNQSELDYSIMPLERNHLNNQQIDLNQVITAVQSIQISSINFSSRNLATKLRSFFKSQAKFDYLRYLNLEENQICDQVAQALFSRKFQTLISLNLSNNSITQVVNHKNFRNLQYLNLQKNKIMKLDFQNFTKDQNIFPFLAYLNLSNNEISDFGMRSLLNATNIFPSMRQLILKQNSIGVSSIQYILDKRPRKMYKNLQFLDISQNCFTKKQALQLNKFFQNRDICPSIKTVRTMSFKSAYGGCKQQSNSKINNFDRKQQQKLFQQSKNKKHLSIVQTIQQGIYQRTNDQDANGFTQKKSQKGSQNRQKQAQQQKKLEENKIQVDKGEQFPCKLIQKQHIQYDKKKLQGSRQTCDSCQTQLKPLGQSSKQIDQEKSKENSEQQLKQNQEQQVSQHEDFIGTKKEYQCSKQNRQKQAQQQKKLEENKIQVDKGEQFSRKLIQQQRIQYDKKNLQELRQTGYFFQPQNKFQNNIKAKKPLIKSKLVTKSQQLKPQKYSSEQSLKYHQEYQISQQEDFIGAQIPKKEYQCQKKLQSLNQQIYMTLLQHFQYIHVNICQHFIKDKQIKKLTQRFSQLIMQKRQLIDNNYATIECQKKKTKQRKDQSQ